MNGDLADETAKGGGSRDPHCVCTWHHATLVLGMTTGRKEGNETKKKKPQKMEGKKEQKSNLRK